MKQIHHFSNAVNLTLTEGQAALLMYRETNREVGYVGYGQHDNVVTTLCEVVEPYNYGDAESFELALKKTITYVENQGLTLLEEDPVITLAKQWACDRVLIGNEGYEWEYDYLINQLNDDDSEFETPNFILVEIEGKTGAQVCEALKKEFAHLREFAFSVQSIQPKTFLLTTDYDGGEKNCWVVKGSYQDAQREMVEALNEILENPLEDQLTTETLNMFIEENVGTSEDYIYTASIEEV